MKNDEGKEPEILSELFETDIAKNLVIPHEELTDTIINERYVVGDVMAVGHIGTVRSGK